MNPNVEKFYSEFKPENPRVVSSSEIDEIMRLLDINLDTPNLSEIRNQVVEWCYRHTTIQNRWSQEKVAQWDKMSSATTVIDRLKVARGEEV